MVMAMHYRHLFTPSLHSVSEAKAWVALRFENSLRYSVYGLDGSLLSCGMCSQMCGHYGQTWCHI